MESKNIPMVDKDLLSIQEARALVRAARVAMAEFSQLDQNRVDAVVKAVAEAAAARAEELACLAVEETGFGKPQDKKIKNILASEKVWAAIKDMKTIGVLSEDPGKKLVEIAVPMGVIAGIIPSTNPTSTVIYKTLISLKSGNAIVFTPHPSARKCIARTVEIIQETLRACHVSPDMVSFMSVPTMQGSAELMRVVDLILATGGPGMVKAAYSSGTPALGVGAGNVPAYIERTADIDDAVAKIFASKTFDNGTICASEQAIITDACIADRVKSAMLANGAYFLEGEKLAKVKAVMERTGGSMNPEIVGRDAAYIAQKAGIDIPAGTKILVGAEPGVGPKFPFSKEKLTSLLGYYVVSDWREACELCIKLLENGGIGHSLAIHSRSEEVIREFGLKKPVSRMLVNTPSTHGAVGLSTSLFPSLTLGCGTVGGSATSDNVTPLNLLNIRRVVYDLGGTNYAAAPSYNAPQYAPAPANYAASSSVMGGAGDPAGVDVSAITAIIIEQLKKMV
ncbi:aldehyde dehydrogenase family protein [Desulfovibrio sp. OttesenSCG-928-G15]|nr:aldehyde dehydrogenase family protein [Desulfovibrio sp. OttesenSCG-928-G15]